MDPPTPDSPGHRALRRGRCSLAGQVYLLTTVTRNRALVFADWELARVAARQLADPSLWREARLLCWVLMPDHFHAMVALGPDEPLPRLMKRVKSVVAQAVNRERGVSGSLWAVAFHDRALRADEDLLDVARYVVANPVRARLATRVGLYPFWDAIWLPPP